MRRKIAENSRLILEKAVEDRFLKGEAYGLKCPPSHILECTMGGEEMPPEDSNARGFAFSWGQLLEITKDDIVTWEIRFEKLHRDFFDLGIPSRELSDRFLDSITGLQIPEYLIFKKGSLRSASAAIILTDPKKEKAARKYLINDFIRGNGCPMNTIVRAIRRAIKASRNGSE